MKASDLTEAEQGGLGNVFVVCCNYNLRKLFKIQNKKSHRGRTGGLRDAVSLRARRRSSFLEGFKETRIKIKD